MAISHIATVTGVISSGTGIKTLDISGLTLVADDLLFVHYGSDFSFTAETPTDYTQAFNNTSSALEHWGGWLVSDGTETEVEIDNTSSRAKQISVRQYRGVDTTTPMDVTPVAPSSSSGTPNPRAITPANDDCMIVALAWLDDDNITATAPTDYGNISTQNGQGGNPGTLMSADRLLSGGASVSEDPGEFGVGAGSDAYGAATIALRPAADSGVTATAGQTLPALQQTAAGEQGFEGSAAQALPTLTQSVSGVAANPITASATSTLPSLSQEANGEQGFQGSAAQTLPVTAQAASGVVGSVVIASATQTLPAASQAALAEQSIEGTVDQALPAVNQSASGGVGEVVASAAQTLPSLQQLVAASEIMIGSAAQSLPKIVQGATSFLSISCAVTQTLPGVRQSLSALVAGSISGTMVQLLPTLTQSAIAVAGDLVTLPIVGGPYELTSLRDENELVSLRAEYEIYWD